MTIQAHPPEKTGSPEIEAMFARYGKRYRSWVVLTAMLGAFAVVMEATIVNIALPEIVAAFGVSHDIVQLVATSFLAATAVAMLASAWAVQRYGLRRVYVTAMGVFVVFSTAAALAPTTHFYVLALCRIGQGIVAGLIQPLAMVAMMSVYPPHKRGRAMSMYGLGIVLSPAIGPMLGGLLVDHFGWRPVFVITTPACLVGAMLATRYLVAGSRAAGMPEIKLDIVGVALLTLALLGLLSGLTLLLEAGSARSPLFLLLGALSLAGFIAWETRLPHPLLDLSLLRNRGFLAASWVTVAYGMGLYGSTYLVPLFVRDVMHFGAFEAGLMLLPGGVVLAVALLVAGRLTDRISPARVVIGGLIFFALSSALLATSTPQSGFWLLALWVALGRVGLGAIIPGLNTGAVKLMAHDSMTKISATVNFLRQLGGAVGVTLLAVFLEARQRGYAVETARAITGAGESGLRNWLQAANGFAESFLLVALVFVLALWPARKMMRAMEARSR